MQKDADPTNLGHMVGVHMLMKSQLLSAALMRVSGKGAVENGLKAIRVVDQRIIQSLEPVPAYQTATGIYRTIRDLQVTSRSLEHLGKIERLDKAQAQACVRECGRFKPSEANKRAESVGSHGFSGFSTGFSYRGGSNSRGRGRGRGGRAKPSGGKFCRHCNRNGHTFDECYSRPGATASRPSKKSNVKPSTGLCCLDSTRRRVECV